MRIAISRTYEDGMTVGDLIAELERVENKELRVDFYTLSGARDFAGAVEQYDYVGKDGKRHQGISLVSEA